ncbi:glycosyltransferase [Methanomethylovorans hollandica DSM 15978]|uniref:Glycosyltransferase n=1 Tax=Methanomethylovorans hollandica (strain DSM 15978 / NBRC 107637 / DMS1) TaxID=867904 RepID=L0KXN6_METHD|nr:glycosyltransferase [Methanomethylovorans hollandica]AGB48754.1 glycosyltransferase [Methanomethylovorans hollandica DSM 15978]
MKILHIRNIANVAYNLSLQQKSLGHQVRILDITENYTNDYEDISLNLPLNYPKKDLLKRFYIIYKILIKLLREENFDIIHLHDGGIFPMDLDIPLLFKFYGKVVIHWHGSKLRNNGKSFGSRFADVHIVSTPDLLEYAPEATWVPNPIGWHGLTKIDRNDGKILIGHAPTNRFYKGTIYFIEAINALKRQYQNVECVLIENTPHKETIELVSKCDIVVDSVGFYDKRQTGWYGILTNEVQQMGIPSCTWIKPSVEPYLEKPNGIINVTKDNLKQELENLMMVADLRKQLGEQGKKYVEKVHNNEKICAEIMELYNILL